MTTLNDNQSPATNDLDKHYIATPLNTIPFDIPLPFPLYIRVAGKLICFRAENDTLTQARIESLETKIDSAYVPRKKWLTFLDMLEKVMVLDCSDVVKVATNMQVLLVAYGKHLEEARGLEKTTINKLRVLGYKLAELIYGNPQLTRHLLRRYQESGVYYASHNTNVAVYSVLIAQKLKYSVEDAKMLCFGCLVHNVGNTLVSAEVLYKSAKLSDGELHQLQKHSELGAELLEYMDAPSEAVVIARQHHERMDGKGYPLKLNGSEIHPFARICTIADVYDALISVRPHGGKAINPTEAIKLMQETKGKFDPEVLRTMGGNA